MLHTVSKVNGPILWANLNLLFWLSLIPFATGWMGENHFATAPTALYGINLLLAAMAYFLLQQTIIKSQGINSQLKKAMGADWKGKSSPIIYLFAILLSLISSWISIFLYIAVALIWIIPDRRIEKIYNPDLG